MGAFLAHSQDTAWTIAAPPTLNQIPLNTLVNLRHRKIPTSKGISGEMGAYSFKN